MSEIFDYKCPNCNASLEFDSASQKMKCPYCGNNVVLSGRLSGVLKPDYVIPFKFDKKAAKDKLKQYVESKKFAPNTFKSENRLDEIKGLYVPFWLFDSDVDAAVKYSATRVRTWSDSKYEYTETSYFDVFRDGEMSFENIPVDGSSKMPDDLMESIEPFKFDEAVDFQTAYLSGYLADKYDVTSQESVERANTRIKKSTEAAFAATVRGYDSVHCESSAVKLKGGKAQYALYPVWLLNTDWNGKKYTFAMNGQTGKLVGNLPADVGKAAGMFLGITGGVGVLGSILWILLHILTGG